MIPFHEYIQVKNNICISYYGSSDEYLILLDIVKPFLEKKFPNLNICFHCKKEKEKLLQEANKKEKFAFVQEIKFNGKMHPVEQLLIECEIKDFIINETITTTKAVIITKGNYPTKPLEKHKIDFLKNRLKGFDIEINTNIDNAGIVAGVESVELFAAAGRKIKTILIPTGIGTQLYKNLFPKGEIGL